MQTLIIKDLSRTEELDAAAMQTVRGGCYSGWKSSCTPHLPVPPVCGVPAPVTSSTDVTISQANNQYQNNATGNGSAVMGGGIYASNNQQGFNAVGGYPSGLGFFS